VQIPEQKLPTRQSAKLVQEFPLGTLHVYVAGSQIKLSPHVLLDDKGRQLVAMNGLDVSVGFTFVIR